MRHVLKIYGIVQGVGFRPTVARYATKHHILGTVSNKGPFVEVIAEGDVPSLLAFEEDIKKRPPKRATILKMDVYEEKETYEFKDFDIVESEKMEGDILISPDIAICEDCKRELYEKGNRRYLHPFINCTCCGPRLTILDLLPYDRERTSMKEFPMCHDCAREYVTESDRRFDAQPVCCNHCGPYVFLLDKEKKTESDIKGREAITKARKTIANGGIVAVKGIGGYHLACDATNEKAVRLLRERKTRPMKPFAVMIKDLDTAEKYCEFTDEKREVLDGHQKPIILLKKKKGTNLAESVAPDNPNVGVMLPYAPLQLLLFDYDDDIKMPDVLVMTSANIKGAPIVKDEESAIAELSNLCDEILAHNRKIRIRADDTVLDFFKDKPYMIRRSRGYAPLPVATHMAQSVSDEVVLGVGGELKNTFCFRVNSLCYESPYVGDMGDVRTVEALKETIGRFSELLEVTPSKIVCDLHPKYNTTSVAEELGEKYGKKVYKIQHHYAHVLSNMAENNLDGKVIGVSFDGTGFGTDNTIWGGEILLSDREGFTRSGHIKSFLQIGGDVSAREGYRIAHAIIHELIKEDSSVFEGKNAGIVAKELGLCDEKESKVLATMHDMKINAVESTSMGRLFDGMSAILGIRRTQTFEGEAATALQFAAERFMSEYLHKTTDEGKDEDMLVIETLTEENPITDSSNEGFIIPTDKLVGFIIKEKLRGEAKEKLAYIFHATLAKYVAMACEIVRNKTGENRVALTGGCYQNTLLLKLSEKELEEKGFEVYIHSLIPPNDGGLSIGQAIWNGFDKGYIGGEKTCV